MDVQPTIFFNVKSLNLSNLQPDRCTSNFSTFSSSMPLFQEPLSLLGRDSMTSLSGF